MSINTVEAFLYKLGNDREMAGIFVADPEAALARYPLSADERRQIREWDLHAIVDSGVSPMLLMFGFMVAKGGMGAREEYVRTLQAPRRGRTADEQAPSLANQTA